MSETDRIFGRGIAPSTIFTADNLDVLQGMNSECIDLIYLDPPFNSNAEYQNPFDREVRFHDVWTMDKVRREWMLHLQREQPALNPIITSAAITHDESMQAYLAYMSIRLVEMQRVLKETGSIYLHCDPTASHYLKAAMDYIFGHRNFVDEVIWNYGTPSGGRAAGKKPVKAHDTLLVYAKSYGKHTYNMQHLSYSEEYVRERFVRTDEDGRRYRMRKRGPDREERQYLDESKGVPLSNVWSDLGQLYANHLVKKKQEETGYPTQKPRALLERIISISSNPGDVVLDPFCGCATACVAAEGMTDPLNAAILEPRRWIGIDISPMAYDIVLQRMESERSIRERDANRRHFTPIGDVTHKVLRYEKEDIRGDLRYLVGGDVPERTDIKEAAEPQEIETRSPNIREIRYIQQDGCCAASGEKVALRRLNTGYIVSGKRFNGPNVDGNIQLICEKHNSMKSEGTMADLDARMREKGETPWAERPPFIRVAERKYLPPALRPD